MTIPTVHLRQVETQWYAPRWVLVRAIHERVFGGKVSPDKIIGGQFLDKDKLWELAFTPLVDLLEEQRASLERAKQAERERLEARRERFRAVQENKAAATELVPAAPSAKSPSERHPKLDRLEVGWVEWDDWEKVGKGRDKRRVKVTRKGEGCTLCFSGTRVYIVFHDREIIKDRKNVRWGLDGEPPAE